MIPPANIMQDESLGKNERDQHETPQSPAPSASQQETKVVYPRRSFLGDATIPLISKSWKGMK